MDPFVAGLNPMQNETDFETVQDSLNLFTKAKVAKDIIDSDFIQVLPDENYNCNASVLNFRIPKTIMPYYLRLSEVYVSLKIALKKKDTTTGIVSDITLDDNLACLNHIQDTLFKV